MKLRDIKVIAIHGDFARGTTLKRDMGDPEWVDYYPNIRCRRYVDLENFIIKINKPHILIGYSSGADHIAKYINARYVCTSLPKTMGVIVYEPMCTVDDIYCECPSIQIWNDKGYLHNRKAKAAKLSSETWSRASALFMEGKGRHFFRSNYPFFGHCWDQSLNPTLERFVNIWRS